MPASSPDTSRGLAGRRCIAHARPGQPAPRKIGAVLFDEPGVKAIEFSQRAHALAHFLRATSGAGALLALLGRRAPEIRHLRRWLGAMIRELDVARPLVAGWFAATAAGALFGPTGEEPVYRSIEVGLES